MRRQIPRTDCGARWTAAVPGLLLAGVLVVVPISSPDTNSASAADADRFAFTGPYRFVDGTAGPNETTRSEPKAAAHPSDGGRQALHLPPGLIPIRITDEPPAKVPGPPPAVRAVVTAPAATDGKSSIVTSALPPQTPAAGDKRPFMAVQRSSLGAVGAETAPHAPPAVTAPGVKADETPGGSSTKVSALPTAGSEPDAASDGADATAAASVPLPSIGPAVGPPDTGRHGAMAAPGRSGRFSARPVPPRSARLSPALRDTAVPARLHQPHPPTSSLLLPTPPWAQRAFGVDK